MCNFYEQINDGKAQELVELLDQETDALPAFIAAVGERMRGLMNKYGEKYYEDSNSSCVVSMGTNTLVTRYECVVN